VLDEATQAGRIPVDRGVHGVSMLMLIREYIQPLPPVPGKGGQGDEVTPDLADLVALLRRIGGEAGIQGLTSRMVAGLAARDPPCWGGCDWCGWNACSMATESDAAPSMRTLAGEVVGGRWGTSEVDSGLRELLVACRVAVFECCPAGRGSSRSVPTVSSAAMSAREAVPFRGWTPSHPVSSFVVVGVLDVSKMWRSSLRNRL
jgi:hypothetical protein